MVPLSYTVGSKVESAEYTCIVDGFGFDGDDILLDISSCNYLSTGITRDPSYVSAAWAGIQYQP